MVATQSQGVDARAHADDLLTVIDPPSEEPRRRMWLRRTPVRRALAWYAISRLVVLAAVIPSIVMGDPGSGPWPTIPGGNSLVRVFGRWDGAWYLWVADHGYPTATQFTHHLSDIAFFPLYPQAARGLSFVTGWSVLATGILLSLALGAVATVLVWYLANRLAGPSVADKAVVLFVFFPGSFVLSMAYAECVMVVASAACLLALLDRRWVLAGVFAALATASRPNATSIVVACVCVAAVEIYRRRAWTALFAPALSVAGVGGFFLYLWIRTGHALAWFESEKKMWHDHVAIGSPIVKRVTGLIAHPPTSFQPGTLNDLIAVIGFVIVAVGLVVVWRSRWTVAARSYTAAALVIPSLSAAVGPRPRMLFGAFPMAALAAERLSPRWYRVAVAASIVGLVALTYATSAGLSATP